MLFIVLLLLSQAYFILGQSAAAETVLLDPQYYNIAPCPCDLQATVCDIGCCCDTACTANDKLLFDCTQGFYGGNTSVELYRRCSSTDRDNPDYHPFTCVLIENYNAYLGMYYPLQTAVRDTTSWESKHQTASTNILLHQFPSDSVLGLNDGSSENKQRKGLLVLQVPSSSKPTVDNNLLANYRLALPRRTLSGGCDHTAGVVYLEDSASTCDVTVTSDLCQANVASPLDAVTYATACNSSTLATCLAQVQTRDGSFVPVSVTYRTLSTAAGYQKSITGSSVETSGTRQSPVVSGSNCNNAVVDVQYSFVWSGQTIVQLDATVKLAPVSINSVVSQRFAASFTHMRAAATSAVKRPGVVGYEPGSPLLGGVRTNSNSPVNTSPTLWPRLWKTNSVGTCSTGQSGDSILFPMDATSYCSESVNFLEFSNCTRLGERLRAKLRAQFSSPNFVLGIFGAANSTVSTDWIPVLEQGIINYVDWNFTRNSTPAWITLKGLCLGLPTEIVLTVLYAEQGKANDSSIWQVVGAYLRYKQAHVTANCSPGTCSDTSVVNLSLSTGVQFVQVPSDWADNSQASFGPYKSPCWWGICWDELAYPLTSDFEGDSKAMCIAWLVFLCLVAVYAFCVSRPWW